MNTPEGILRAGELLNNTYVIEKLIGSGGTGEVYLAKNIVSGRKFAIKILKQEFSQNEAFINLMRREADVLHNVIDDAVVRYNELLKSEMHGGFVFLVMEFIEGPQLAEIMQSSGPMDPNALLQVARRMGQGLAAAHAQNAFHRDISPDNIILPSGDPTKAKLIDFGIARDISENAQTVVGGGFAGKYQYASPEQLNGDVDARSDLYSLGVTLLNAFRGKSSQIGSSLMEIVQVKAQRVDTRDVPGQLGELISRLVEPRPEDRFQSAAEMVRWLGGAPMATAPISAPSPPSEPAMITPSKPATSFQALPEEPGGGLGKFMVLLLIAALGGGGWFFGFGPGKEMVFPAKYEAESPYTIRARHDDGANFITIAGFVRGPEAGAEMLAQLQLTYSEFTINPSLENASGEPNDRWEQIFVSMVKEAKPLNSWKVEMIDEVVSLSGEAQSEAAAEAVRTAFEATGKLVDVDTSISITVAIPPLPLGPLNDLMATYQTCGPLRITGGDGTVLGPNDRMTVSGIIARESDVEVFDHVLNEAASGRGIDYNLGVLSEPICEMEAILPAPQDNGMELHYSYGVREGEVGNQPFHAGENPVIDLLMPSEVNGFLYAFYVGAEGKVYHFIPHLSRQTHTVPPIGEAVDGKQSVRLAYPIAVASTEDLGFTVAAPFGTNMLVVILTKRPLFDSLRPREESIAALQEALAPQANLLNDPETMVISRYLVTEP